jgi:hypothetical protein
MTSIYFIFDYLSAFSKKAGQKLSAFSKKAGQKLSAFSKKCN